ncbi:MAG: ATP-binding protein [Thermoflexales bacterium]|nr:ATP-binding protein [Thermoflexales bacterium]
MMTTLYLPSVLGYEKVVMASAEAIAQRLGFSPDRIDDIKTAVAEACVNAIEHGNALERALPLRVDLSEEESGLEISVSDAGRQSMPSAPPRPGCDPCHRGWGMFLIQRLVDEFDFGPAPHGGNIVRMRLYLEPGYSSSS